MSTVTALPVRRPAVARRRRRGNDERIQPQLLEMVRMGHAAAFGIAAAGGDFRRGEVLRVIQHVLRLQNRIQRIGIAFPHA